MGAGLLSDENRNFFNIIDKQTNKKQQILTTKQLQPLTVCYGSGDKTITEVTLEFSSSMLGIFKQWIVFDFGKKPHLYREVEVHVGSVDDDADDDLLDSQLPVEEVWNNSHPDYVPLNARDKSEFNVEPIMDNVADISDTLQKDNYKDYMLTLLDLEEQCRIDLLKR